MYMDYIFFQVKFNVYKNNPQLIPELKDEIISIIGEIEPQLWPNAFENKRVNIWGYNGLSIKIF